MTWKFKYDEENDETVVEWRSYSESFDGKITTRKGGYPADEDANEAVNSLLQSINSIPDALEATAEFRPGMIEYEHPESDQS